jgi:fructose-1,6-bisphosphatase/inositol monophosphatase family enzyme
MPPPGEPSSSTIEAPDGRELVELAQLAAEEAATLLVEGLARTRELVGTKSTGTDMVTEMDHAAERHIVEVISRSRPRDGLVGEEGTAREGTSGVRWLIDPIDGTTNYLYGHPGFAVSIGAAFGDEVVAGVVVDPLHGDVFTAVRGGGARRNGEPIAISHQPQLGNALIATGFSYDPQRRRRQANVLEQVLPLVRDIRRMGAAAVDLCSVACGRVDGFYEKGLQPWDIAAGGLIAAEAGALLGDLDGGPPSGAFVLATGEELFHPLRQLLRRAGAADA